MLIKTEGIIFRSFKYSETSLIIDVFTKEHGLLSFIISGVRKKKSTVSAAMLQVMNIVDIVAYTKNNNSLGRITEIKNNYVHHNLLYDFVKSSIGVFIIELSRNCIKEKEPNIHFFDFIKTNLIYLDNASEGLSFFTLLYLVKFSKYLGFYPHDNYSDSHILFDWREGCFVQPLDQNHYTTNERTSYFIHQLLNTSLDSLNELILKKKERQVVMDLLLKYYKYHVESFKELKSYAVLEEIMKN